MLHVLVLRDPKEGLQKCSLTPLRGCPGVDFVEYAPGRIVRAGRRVLLHTEGELLSPADLELAPEGLLLLDCAWRRVPKLVASLEGELVPRRLPALETAYPRRSKVFADPAQGLASVEALYAASVLLGRPRLELLEGYRWRAAFLKRNPVLAASGSLPADA